MGMVVGNLTHHHTVGQVIAHFTRGKNTVQGHNWCVSLSGPKDTGEATVDALGSSLRIGSLEINVMTTEC